MIVGLGGVTKRGVVEITLLAGNGTVLRGKLVEVGGELISVGGLLQVTVLKDISWRSLLVETTLPNKIPLVKWLTIGTLRLNHTLSNK